MSDAVVSIEVNDRVLTVFTQCQNGSVISKKSPFHYFLMSSSHMGNQCRELKGDNSYRFMKKYSKKCDFWRDYKFFNDVFAIFDEKEAARILIGIDYYRGLELKSVGILSFDLETTSLERNDDSKILLIANTFRQGDRVTRKLFSFDEYLSQGDMLMAWCQWVRIVDPSIILGHHIYGFDIPYLEHIAKTSGVKLRLGRDDSDLRIDKFESHFRKDGSQSYSYKNVHIYGREVIDTLHLSIKHDTARKYETYGLKQIIKQEGLERADRQHYDASQIQQLYKDAAEWLKIKAYAVGDADDALALFDFMAPPFFYLTRTIPKSFQSVINSAPGKQIDSWLIRSYLAMGHSLPKASDPIAYEGAISLGNPGLYLNCMKVDVSSLYPSIMLHYNVYNKEKDPSAHFSKMVEQFTTERLKYKKLHQETGLAQYKAMSDALKILINSAYGFMGAKGLLFNSPRHAAFVTEKGREILTQAMDWCSQKDFTLVNADTDSITFCKSDQTYITVDERTQFLSEINALYPDKIKWEDDGYYDAILVLKAKNYVLKKDSQLIIKGSALKATNKEPALREFIQRVVSALIENRPQDVDFIYDEYVTEIEHLSDPKRWASKKTITPKVLQHSRTHELKVFSAIQNSDYREGDKAFVYFTPDGALKLVEHWNKDHCKDRLRKKLKATLAVLRGKKK